MTRQQDAENTVPFMTRRARDLGLLSVLWMVVTVPFLGKAFHIDDTVHVLQAEHIVENPTRPLDLQIFWFEWPEWLKDSNPVTPPVWQYELAAAVAMSDGAKEAPLNLLSAFHLLILAVSVYSLAGQALGSSPLALMAAALVLTSPAAIVGRNVMLDVPMMSYLAAGLATALAGLRSGRDGLLACGCLLVGVASVTKLPGIVGAAVLAGTLVDRRRWRKLPLVALAFLPLALWYLYQLLATGGIDILRPRGGGGFVPEHSLETRWQVARDHLPFWGGATFAGHALIAALAARRFAWWPLALLPLTAILALAVVGIGMPFDPIWLLGTAFWIGGGSMAVGAVLGARHLWLADDERRSVACMLSLWALGHLAFDVAGLWEMNVRFAFLSAVPATVLCVAEIDLLVRRTSTRRPLAAAACALVLGAVVSLLVASADMQWANGYRRLAHEIARENGGAWFVGHWGFQHYATAEGLVAYSPRDDEISPGDRLVVPLLAARQTIPELVVERLTELDRHTIVPTLPVRTMHYGGGFYSTGWGALPWGWSREPADVIVVTRLD